MKFFVSATPIANAPALPPDPDRPKKMLAAIEKGKAGGNWLGGYLTVDGGGFSVMEAASAEELFDAIHTWPTYARYAWRIEPVMSMEEWIKSQMAPAPK